LPLGLLYSVLPLCNVIELRGSKRGSGFAGRQLSNLLGLTHLIRFHGCIQCAQFLFNILSMLQELLEDPGQVQLFVKEARG